jgi:hypothetical protein
MLIVGRRLPVVLESLLAVAALLPMPNSGQTSATSSRAEVEIKQKYLLALCLDGASLEADERRFRLASGPHSIAFTMRNDPRSGSPMVPDAAPGVAVVRFTLEPGRKYEVEVRAPEVSFSSRVWSEGDWKPVVRDRTVDRIVSSDPEWKPPEAACRVE